MSMDALEKATSYLNLKPHTAKEVYDYLIRKGYEPGESEAAVNQLSEYGYIDDLAYAKMYFAYGFEKGRGAGRIMKELTGKGVPRDTVDRAYAELDEKPDEYEMAAAIASQIIAEAGKDTTDMDYAERQKLQAKIVRRLASRGFSGSVCYSVARELVK